MNIWLTTDTHFGHANMIDYCGRPKDFEERIIKSHVQTVREEDLLIHLGDICIGNDEKNHNTYIQPIKGKKILVKGNHDNKSNNWYLGHGWDFVCEQFVDVYFGKRILFSHIPKPNGDYDFNIHGHFHNTLNRLQKEEYISDAERKRNKGVLTLLTNKHKLLALEYTDYKPVNLGKFL